MPICKKKIWLAHLGREHFFVVRVSYSGPRTFFVVRISYSGPRTFFRSTGYVPRTADKNPEYEITYSVATILEYEESQGILGPT